MKPKSLNTSALQKEDKQLAASNLNEVWLDKQDILQLLHISSRTLQNWRDKELLPYSKIGGKIYYKQSDLQKLLDSSYVNYRAS